MRPIPVTCFNCNCNNRTIAIEGVSVGQYRYAYVYLCPKCIKMYSTEKMEMIRGKVNRFYFYWTIDKPFDFEY